MKGGIPSQVRKLESSNTSGIQPLNRRYKDTLTQEDKDKKNRISEKGIITFNRKYAEEKKGKFVKKMKNINSFVFECNLSHRFVLSNKQVVNGKWCKSCSKAVEKLRKKVSKEEFEVLNFNSDAAFAENIRSILKDSIEQSKNEIENMMIEEEVQREIRERKSLESGFQRWTKLSSTMQRTESKNIYL